MKAILFDLDGTLLPMDPMLFVKSYNLIKATLTGGFFLFKKS